jgi:protein-disulfide isomerase
VEPADSAVPGLGDAVSVNRRTYVVAGVVACLVAAMLIAASVLSASGGEPAGGGEPAAAQKVFGDDTTTLLHGIPQKGVVLGRPDAPVTLVEFADLQCPYCAQWSQQAFPEIVRDYVRTGKVRLVFGGLSFLGPDSEQALRFALAAGDQGKLWNAVHLLYGNQGPENPGWVTDDLLRGIGAAIPGLRTQRALDTMSSPPIEEEMANSATLSTRLGVRGTPAFAAGRTGSDLSLVPVRSLDAGGLRPTLDELLGR